MNKNIKHIIAATLVISAFSILIPGKVNYTDSIGFGTVTANASTYTSAANGQLNSLSVYRGTGKEIQLYSNLALTKETELTASTDYYMELKGSEGVDINAEVEGDGYVVKVFTSNDNDAKGYDPSEIGFIPIDSGNTKIYLRTYRSEDEYNDASDDKDVKNCLKTYTLHIYKDDISSDEEDDVEYPYIKSLYLSDGDINFSKNTKDYNLNVDEDIKEIIVRAEPDDDDDLVEINGDSVDENDDYEKTVKLEKGENTIKITVENDDETTTYSIVVNRGGNSSKTDNNINSNNVITGSDTVLYNSGKRNSLISDNGKYMYINGIGQALKSMWWFDINSVYDYYFDEEGYAKTGWAQIDGKWYFFNNNAQMQKGWMSNDGKWYYLNASGAMVTGWYKDSTGKWYYLNEDGSMKTGWLSQGADWYLLNSDGSMVTGKVLVDGVPYNFNSDGKMM